MHRITPERLDVTEKEYKHIFNKYKSMTNSTLQERLLFKIEGTMIQHSFFQKMGIFFRVKRIVPNWIFINYVLKYGSTGYCVTIFYFFLPVDSSLPKSLKFLNLQDKIKT